MPNTHATTADIVALEKSYWDAVKQKDGSKTAKLSAETSLVTGARGIMKISKDKMGAMTEDGDWTLNSYEFEDIEVSTPAPDIAIIVYTVRQKVNIGGKAQELRAADSSTWIRSSNGWECHAHSETFLT
ncbi:nuclear transport factor 2 family protein [Devosia rhodophyticola]|uniref:Nuclear transport factor 2 family protein n=1 Tax=Devosia rhodophyticola TaxID=3026423 RepID=A0ABY7YWI6_9HYPH|nr:nuclear transport factor 2 family protein [Devosia rhodophyticola]WDR05547.1 nuclear transport factor 2 family protein [Devosia rhodophyticola]